MRQRQPRPPEHVDRRAAVLYLIVVVLGVIGYGGGILLLQWPRHVAAALLRALATVLFALAGLRTLLWFWPRRRHAGEWLVAALPTAWLVLSLVGG